MKKNKNAKNEPDSDLQGRDSPSVDRLRLRRNLPGGKGGALRARESGTLAKHRAAVGRRARTSISETNYYSWMPTGTCSEKSAHAASERLLTLKTAITRVRSSGRLIGPLGSSVQSPLEGPYTWPALREPRRRRQPGSQRRCPGPAASRAYSRRQRDPG